MGNLFLSKFSLEKTKNDGGTFSKKGVDDFLAGLTDFVLGAIKIHWEDTGEPPQYLELDVELSFPKLDAKGETDRSNVPQSALLDEITTKRIANLAGDLKIPESEVVARAIDVFTRARVAEKGLEVSRRNAQEKREPEE